MDDIQSNEKNKILAKKGAVSGALAGIINGIFGTGGGTVLVPLFSSWLKLGDKPSFASSVAAIFPMCVVSSITYYLRGSLDLAAGWPYLLGGLIGGIISGISFKRVPTKLLRRLFAILIIYGGIRSLL